MPEGRINRKFVEAVGNDATVGLPLFAGVTKRPSPPERVTDSSARIDTFRARMNDGSLNASRNKVLALIKRHEKHLRTLPCGGVEAPEIFGTTIIDLRDKYFVPINEASGRCSELERLGYINRVGKKQNPETGRPISIYIIA